MRQHKTVNDSDNSGMRCDTMITLPNLTNIGLTLNANIAHSNIFYVEPWISLYQWLNFSWSKINHGLFWNLSFILAKKASLSVSTPTKWLSVLVGKHLCISLSRLLIKMTIIFIKMFIYIEMVTQLIYRIIQVQVYA